MGEEGDPKRRVGNSLQAGEHNIRFVGEPVTKITPDGSGGLVGATDRLASEGVDSVTLGFFVTSKDLIGHQERERVFGWERTVELQPGGMNIEEIRDAPGHIEIDGETFPFV